MSVWQVPPNFVNGGLSATDLNKLSADLTFLKGALDLLTNASTADTGTGTLLSITRPAVTDVILNGLKSGESNARIQLRPDGIRFGDGTGAPASYLGPNNGAIQFDRVAANVYPMKLFTKSGVINDTDIPGTFIGAGSGMIGVDTSNNRLYVRVNATWRFATLT